MEILAVPSVQSPSAPLTGPLPLEAPDRAVRFCTEDVDEVRKYAFRFDGCQSRQASGAGPLRYEFSVLEGRWLRFGWQVKSQLMALQGRAGSNYLQFPLAGELRHAWGRQRVQAAPGDAVFAVAGQYGKVETTPGRFLAVDIPSDLLHPQVGGADLDNSRGWTLRSCRIRAGAKGLESLRVLLAEAIRLASLPAEHATQAALEAAEAASVSQLVEVLADARALVRFGVMTETRTKQLENWIEQHLAERITLRVLSKVSGVGARSLQKSFIVLRGLSPMQYVLQRRLEVARHRLMYSASASDVTRVAMECGFTHMGRFSVMYRQRFGESPSTTLRR